MQSSRQIVTINKPTPSCLQTGCPFCRPTNSVKALKGKWHSPTHHRKPIPHIRRGGAMGQKAAARPQRWCALQSHLSVEQHGTDCYEDECQLTDVRHDFKGSHMSILTAIFAGGPGLCGTRMSPFWILLELKMMEVVSGDNWSYKTCEAPVKLSPPTNQHQVFYRPDALPVAKPTASKH